MWPHTWEARHLEPGKVHYQRNVSFEGLSGEKGSRNEGKLSHVWLAEPGWLYLLLSKSNFHKSNLLQQNAMNLVSRCFPSLLTSVFFFVLVLSCFSFALLCSSDVKSSLLRWPVNCSASCLFLRALTQPLDSDKSSAPSVQWHWWL